jgi:hypothetical protein
VVPSWTGLLSFPSLLATFGLPRFGLKDGDESWTPEEHPVESCEYQDNPDIHYQAFPKSISEEHEIDTDYDGYHRQHEKHHDYLSVHFRSALT